MFKSVGAIKRRVVVERLNSAMILGKSLNANTFSGLWADVGGRDSRTNEHRTNVHQDKCTPGQMCTKRMGLRINKRRAIGLNKLATSKFGQKI